MKKLMLFILPLFLFSCNEQSNITELASVQHDGSWYWILQLNEKGTKEEAQKFVEKWANPKQTSYFFFYPLSATDEELPHHPTEIKDTEPLYGFYKMPLYEDIYDDALELMQLE